MPLLEQVSGHRAAIVARTLTGSPQDKAAVLAHLAGGYLRQGMLTDVGATAELLQSSSAARSSVEEAQESAHLAALFTEEDHERVVDGSALSRTDEMAHAMRQFVDGDSAGALSFLEQHPAAVRLSGKNVLFYGYLLYLNEQFDVAHKTLIRARDHADNQDSRAAITYYLARKCV